MFMLTKQGRVQFWQQDGWTGMVLAEQPEALHEFRSNIVVTKNLRLPR